MQTRIILCLLFPFTLMMCKQNEEKLTILDAEQNGAIIGSWKLTEEGYSPGNGYTTNEVSDEESGIVAFHENFQFESDLEGLSQYKYYKLFKNAENDWLKLSLFLTLEDLQGATDEPFQNFYFIAFQGDLLKLHNSMCIEGCHMGFKKVTVNK